MRWLVTLFVVLVLWSWFSLGCFIRSNVKFSKVLFVLVKSWLAFALAAIILIAFWALCYFFIASFAEERIVLFEIAFWLGIGAGLTALIFNEVIARLKLKCKRIKHREQCPKLWDAVHSVVHGFGPRPRIYIIPGQGVNTISFGWGMPFFSAVGATQGAVDTLNEDELRGAMAHEIAHIINKDMVVSIALTIVLMFIAFTGWLIKRSGGVGGSSDDKKVISRSLTLLLIGGALYYVGKGIGILLQMFVSRQREYAADATSARLIGSSQPLSNAIQKMVVDPSIGTDVSGAAFGFLCAADPEPKDALATHPDIERRLKRLKMLEG